MHTSSRNCEKGIDYCKYFLENRASEYIGVSEKSIVCFGNVTGFWIIEFHVSFLTDIY